MKEKPCAPSRLVFKNTFARYIYNRRDLKYVKSNSQLVPLRPDGTIVFADTSVATLKKGTNRGKLARGKSRRWTKSLVISSPSGVTMGRATANFNKFAIMSLQSIDDAVLDNGSRYTIYYVEEETLRFPSNAPCHLGG